MRRGPSTASITPLVPASIADLVLDLPPSVFADAELGGEIAPFAAVLLRSESAASSQIAAMTVANIAAVALSDTVDAHAISAMAKQAIRQSNPHRAGLDRRWLAPVGATFVGPRHEVILDAVSDLIAFAHRADLPALPHTAAHSSRPTRAWHAR